MNNKKVVTNLDIKKLVGTLDDLDIQEVINLNLLLNSMAFAIDFGLQPYVEIFQPETYKVYYDYRKREGEFRVFDLLDLDKAAEWIKEHVHDEIENNPDAIKNHPDYKQ